MNLFFIDYRMRYNVRTVLRNNICKVINIDVLFTIKLDQLA